MGNPRTKPLAVVPPVPEPQPGARIGWLVGVTPGGRPLVDYPGSPSSPREAASAMPADPAALEAAAARRQRVVLLFEGGDVGRPILLTFLADAEAEAPPPLAEVPAAPLPDVVTVDGRRVCLEGADEIVLRCGKASITLRRNGKVVIRGTYLESHAEGTNRIKGGSVQIN